MRYFLDTEFLEDGKTIMPISLALVREDGAHLYIEFPFDRARAEAHDFVRENVLPHLRAPTSWFRSSSEGKLWWDIKREGGHASGHDGAFGHHIDVFLDGDPAPEFWADYADYDWVLFCQRYGTMTDLPSQFPQFCMDLQQWYVQLGCPEGAKPPEPANAHDALADARWNATFYDNLARLEDERAPERDNLSVIRNLAKQGDAEALALLGRIYQVARRSGASLGSTGAHQHEIASRDLPK